MALHGGRGCDCRPALLLKLVKQWRRRQTLAEAQAQSECGQPRSNPKLGWYMGPRAEPLNLSLLLTQTQCTCWSMQSMTARPPPPNRRFSKGACNPAGDESQKAVHNLLQCYTVSEALFRVVSWFPARQAIAFNSLAAPEGDWN